MKQLRQQNAQKIKLNCRGSERFFRLRKVKRKDNIIKHIKNIFRLRKEIGNSATKNIKILFRLKKQKETIKDKITRNIETLFEQEDDYYKPIKVGNFWNYNYIGYESNNHRNKNLLVREHIDEIKPFLKDIITDLQKSRTWKVQLTITINFISSKDNNEEQVMQSKSDDIEVMS